MHPGPGRGASQSLQHVPYGCIKAKPVWVSECDFYMKNGETGDFDFFTEVEYTRFDLAITEPMEGSLVGAGNQITVRGVVEEPVDLNRGSDRLP